MKNILYFFSAFFATIFIAAIPYIWPRELSLIFNNLFWTTVSQFCGCCLVIWFLYSHGGSSQGTHFAFALLLILQAALMYGGFEQIMTNSNNWKPFLQKDYPKLFVLLPQLIEYTKNIVAFGFAALGASVAANVISKRLKAQWSDSN